MLHACRSQKIELASCQGGLSKSRSADTSHLAPPPSLHSKGGHSPTRNLLTQGSDMAWAVCPERHDSASSSMEFRQGPAMPGSAKVARPGQDGHRRQHARIPAAQAPDSPFLPGEHCPCPPACHTPLSVSAPASPHSRPQQCAHSACGLTVWAAPHFEDGAVKELSPSLLRGRLATIGYPRICKHLPRSF